MNLKWIEPSFAARRFESSGGRSLHNDSASSKLPAAVNCTIWNEIVKSLAFDLRKHKNIVLDNQVLLKEVKCFTVFSLALESKNRYHIMEFDHKARFAIPGLQEEQERGHEQNFLKQESLNYCFGEYGVHFEELLSVSVDMEPGEIESAKCKQVLSV